MRSNDDVTRQAPVYPLAMTAPHRLTVWQKADLLAQRICVAIACDAAAPHADLVARLRGAAMDIPLQIDAGARATAASEFADHIDRAIMLTHDVQYFLSLNQALGRLASTECARLQARTDQVQRMLAGLRRTVEQRTHRPAAKVRDAADRPTIRRRPRASPSVPGD
jgi:four helix bundle protein